LTLTSRSALADARRGSRVKCRACNAIVDAAAANILDPKSSESRARRAAVAEERARSTAAARELEQKRRDAISAAYPVLGESGEELISAAPFLARIGALAALHVIGHRDGLIYPVNFGANEIAPSRALSSDLFIAAWHAGLLRVHPTSPTDAFTWSSETALGDSIYLERARFFAGGGTGTFGERVEELATGLRSSLDLATLGTADRAELAELATRIIAEEATRYLVYKLREHRMAELAETHVERLRTAAGRGASLFAIGHLYRMAWSSARDAASAYQRHPGMPRENAAVHGLNQFERWVQRSCDNPAAVGAPYSEEKGRLPLSSVTGIAFSTIMGLDPMKATPAEVARVLDTPEHDELMPFAKLMGLVNGLSPEEGQLAAGDLAVRWREPVRRVADAIDAVKVLHGVPADLRGGREENHSPRTAVSVIKAFLEGSQSRAQEEGAEDFESRRRRFMDELMSFGQLPADAP
jgi:hypothetical protein